MARLTAIKLQTNIGVMPRLMEISVADSSVRSTEWLNGTDINPNTQHNLVSQCTQCAKATILQRTSK
eukprot:COSAG01_NODE_16459_length_1235_cov_1.719190_2_plen_66_part_01